MCHQTSDNSDLLIKAATFCVVGCNFLATIYFFYTRLEKEDRDKDEKNKIDLYKELIIKPNIEYFSEFFENILNQCNALRSSQDPLVNQSTFDLVESELYAFRSKFTDSLRPISNELYSGVRDSVDKLQDNLSNAILGNTLNLSEKDIFENNIVKKIRYCKNDITKLLFQYNGKAPVI